MKYFVGILVLCLLIMAEACCRQDPWPSPWINDQSCYSTCSDKPGGTDAPAAYPAETSPAGGPAAHPDAAVCYFYRSSNCIVCRQGGRIKRCCTAIPRETDDTKYGGPMPYNEYLIGTAETPWHNLFPKRADNATYMESTETGRSGMGLILHDQYLVTSGSVSVHDEIYIDGVKTSCWDQINEKINNGTLHIKNSEYDGFLYVVQD